MKTKSSILTLLLTASMLMAGLVSCGDSSSDSGENTQKQTEGTASKETASDTDETRVTANLPERDFGNEDFVIYARIYEDSSASGSSSTNKYALWAATDLISHDEEAETINDAVYERTVYIEETYNVNLVLMESGEGSDLDDVVRTQIQGGSVEFDALAIRLYELASLAQQGCLLDLNTVENFDFSAEWWSQSLIETMQIQDKLFYATGDLMINDNRSARMIFFNKNLISDLDLDDPYELVRNNQWTWEAYMRMNTEAMKDMNGDNKYEVGEDRFGTMAQDIFGTVLYLGAGETLSKEDENGYPQIACASERALTILNNIMETFYSDDSISTNDSDTNLEAFSNGQALFFPEVLAHIESLRNSSMVVGMLPNPKYTEEQDRYYCFADGHCLNGIAIPVTNLESEKAGFILEAMAADSLNNLTPAYFDIALKSKYSQDEDSPEMLDLILDSIVVDNANIFVWGDLTSKISENFSKGQPFASLIEKYRAKVERDISKTITALEDLE